MISVVYCLGRNAFAYLLLIVDNRSSTLVFRWDMWMARVADHRTGKCPM